jgi:hypothetical protein
MSQGTHLRRSIKIGGIPEIFYKYQSMHQTTRCTLALNYRHQSLVAENRSPAVANRQRLLVKS